MLDRLDLSAIAAVVVLLATDVTRCSAQGDSISESRRVVADIVEQYCIDCHGESRPKGGFRLEYPGVSAGDLPSRLDARALRILRDRLRRQDMPPAGENRPSNAEYEAIVALLNQELDRRAESAAPGRPTLRRLNRVEYRNSVRALTGIDIDVESALPADDVGEGFDHIGDVLSMSPVLLEKYLDIAERVALRAWPDRVEPARTLREGGQLEITDGGGRVINNVAMVWSRGAAGTSFDVPRAGAYRVQIRVAGDQAGSEPVRVAVLVGRERVAYFDIPEARRTPGMRTLDLDLDGGSQRISVEFLNDFYDESLPKDARDRNLVVTSIGLDGPMDRAGPTRELRALAGEAPSIESFLGEFLPRAFRRPVDDDEKRSVAAIALRAAGESAPQTAQIRAVMIAALVDPRFLFRIELDPTEGESERVLSAHEIASRLSYALWSSPPDDFLRTAADRSELLDERSLSSMTDRLLDDPRSITLAENFGQQWLLIRAVGHKELDPTQFPQATPELLADMKAETTLFLDRMLREDRPLKELLSADWSYLNQRLAEHYGVSGIEGDWLRPVHLGDARVPGLLGHGSVAVATSNPTRTSPVKRGKWVLEALLDAPPPPPPPGVPALAENASRGTGRSMRELLASHRADPGCASCHVRMDGIGFVLESIDPVGRMRTVIDGEPIELAEDLPGIGRVDGPHELALALSNDPDVMRSIVRHLYVYMLGRSMTMDDELIVDRIARALPPDATFRDAVHSIVLSKAFRNRAARVKEAE